MEIGVLGPLRLQGARGEIELRGLREQLLLAHLVVAGGRIVTVSTLIDGLWGDEPPRTAGKSLQNVVLRLRKALGPDRSLVVTQPTGYRLALDDVDVDSTRFEALQRAGALPEALALWRGAAYAGLDGAPVVAAEARRLEELRAAALEARVATDLENGMGPATVAELEALVGRYPTRERLWALLMTALYQQGRQADALAAYDRARATLAADLGLDPGPDLRDLQSRVLAQDPALDARSAGPVLPAPLTSAAGPLVGRERELTALREAWAGARAGQQVAVVVRGPVGAGARRLAAAFAQEVAGEAGPVTYVGPQGAATGSGGRRGGPALQVRGRGAADAETPRGPSLRLDLSGPDAVVPDGAAVVDLSPLSREDVRRLVTGVAPDSALDEVADHAFAASAGWPSAALAAAVVFVRERATAAVASASTTADVAAATLVDARARVADGVLDLRAVTGGPLPPERCPWPGLAAYAQDDGPWFAGRERLVAELAARMAGASCLAVVGSSGSGKSSVVHAGLLAGLADGLLPGSAGWDLLTMRPGSRPVAELARVVLGARRPDLGEVLERLVRSADQNGDGAGGRTVLVVDQLEEVWTACTDDHERTAFLDALAGLVADSGSPVVLVLVVRADYLDRLADQPGLAAAAGDNTVLVGTPTPDDVRRAVLTPATRAGLQLEAGLLDAVVADAGAEPGLLPLLSTSLRRLWEQRDGNRLSLAAYVGTDGLRGAIAHLAESEHARLDADGQRDVRSLLLRLAGPGEGDAVTRRRVTHAELAALPRDPTRLVERLAAARLLTVSDDHVEVAHEALFREWPRLRAWLEEDRAGREVERRLAVATAEWRSEARDPALLWRGARLEAGLEVVAAHPDEVTADERAFLDAGREAAEGARRSADRQNRRLRVLLAAAVALVLVAATAGGVALRSRDREAEAAGAAEDAAVTADARRLAASALTVEQPDLALLTAVEATRLEPSPETFGAVLTLLARQPDVVTRVRATDRFLSVAATPDGTTVFLGEARPVLRAVDAETGEQRWLRDDLEGLVSWLAVSPDGRTLAALVIPTTPDGADSVVLLDPATGRETAHVGIADVNAFTGAQDPYLWQTLGWTDSGQLLVATDSAAVVLDQRGRRVTSVAWEWPVADTATFLVWPDGGFSTGPSGLGPGVVSQVGKPSTAARRVEETVLAVDPGGRRLAATRTTETGAELLLLGAGSLRAVSTAWPIDGTATMARFSPDGRRLLVGAGERVEVRDGRTAAPVAALTGHSGAVNSGAYAGGRQDLAWTAGLDGTAVGFDLTGRRGVFATWTAGDTPWAGEGAADADTVVWTDRNDVDVNAAYLLRDGDARGRRLPLTGLEDCTCEATSSDLTADGSLALAGVRALTEDFAELPGRGYVVAWDTSTLEVRGVVETPWPVYSVDSAPSGDTAVVLGAGGWGVVDLDTFTVTRTADLDRWTRSGYGTSLVEVAPDAASAALLVGPDVLLVDPTRGSVLRRRTVEPDPAQFAQSAAWTPDGQDLAVGTTSGWFTVLDGESLATRVPRRRVTPSVLTDVEVSPDGRTAATIGPQGDVTLWDTGSWRPYGEPVVDDRAPGFLRFDPDSTRLVVRTSDGGVSEVDVRPAAWIAAACEAASRELTPEEWAVVRPGEPRRPTCDRPETEE